MGFSPVEASKNITDKYYRYLKTSFKMGEPYNKEFDKLIDSNVFAKGPFLDVTDAFCKGLCLNELIDEGILPKSFSKINMNMTRPLYLHQEKAIRKIAEEGRNLVVSTGTGSGKTESFLIPVLRHLSIEDEQGSLGAGVRALLVYPMNALANDQVERLRGLLADYPEITYGVYTGQTKHTKEDALAEYQALNDNQKPLPNELISREAMMDSPPNILITNYAMLEYLMLRPKENVFFDGEYANNWKFIVFDEAHVYNGSTGIEVSMLFRRLKAKLHEQKLTYILTSATLGSKKEDDEVAEFAHNLCNAPFEKNDIIRAYRIEPTKQSDLLETRPVSFYKTLADAKNDFKSDEDILSLLGEKVGELSSILYDMIAQDENYWKIRKLLEKPRTVKFITNEMGWSEDQLVDFVTVASIAEKNGAKLFDAKYHMFIRATESAFVTLAPHNRVFLDRRKYAFDEQTGETYKVFEAASCSYCSSIYLVGTIINKCLEQFNGSDEIEQKEVFLLASSISDTDDDHLLEEEGFKAEPYFLCPYCGRLRGENDKSGCQHNPHDSVKVYRATSISEKRTLTKCLSCENVNNSGVLRMFFSGQEAATSVIGTALFEELPSYEIEIVKKVEEFDEFGFGTPEDTQKTKSNKIEKAKQFIAFSDSRQAAAFYSSYLSTSYNNILYKRIILEAFKDIKADTCSVEEFVNRVQRIFDKYEINGKSENQGGFWREKEAWKAVLAELIDNNGNTSLCSMGLLGIEANIENKPLPAYHLSEEEFRHMFSIFAMTMLSDAAINYGNAPITDSDLEDFTHGGVKTAYTLSDATGTRRKSFLPSKEGCSNKRLDYLHKIMVAKQKKYPSMEIPDYDKMKRLLEILWKNFLLSKGLMVLSSGNSYEVSCDKINVVAPTKVYRCSKCKKITIHNIENVCPSYHCDGELQEIDCNEIFANNHYYNIYNQLDIKDLRVVEHTAQLDRDMAYDYQKKFKQKEIDVLSCSTTFEMGVDVGSLETVFMRNMPPLPSNYAQRAGRAGRSSKSAAFALTFCNKSNHDFSYFKDPTMMIRGKIDPPKYTVENDRIAIRHLYAAAFSYFWRLNENYFGTISNFLEKGENGTSGFECLKRYFQSKPDDLKEYILRFIPKSLALKYDIENFGWLDSLIGDEGILTIAVEAYFYELNLLNDHLKQMFDDGKNIGHIQQRIRVYQREDMLSFLSRKNVLPKYGFPVDTVEMSVSEKSNGAPLGLQLQRDLSVAISEYAPGSQIVANNNLITSRYIKKIPRIGWKTYSYIRCDKCNTLNTRPFTEDGDTSDFAECCRCHNAFDESPKTFIIPEQGFIADSNSIRKPGLKKPERTYRGEISYVGLKDDVEINHYSVGKAIVEIKTTQNDEMAVLNTSPFYVCETCGYAVLDKKHFVETKKEPHKNSSNFKCSNNFLKRTSLGYRFLTDVVQISFKNHSINDREEGLSILYGLLRGICLSLNIEESDIAGCLQSYPDENGMNYAIVIFDKTPGGAGHAKRLNDEKVLNAVFNKTLSLMKGCVCGGDEGESSCYSCLRNYSNQKYHDMLQRKYVIDFLSEIL